jgi:hypothetical protein
LGQRHGRDGEGGDGSECHQFLLHDVTFLDRTKGQRISGPSWRKFHTTLE